jgi:hypothetical protein
MKQLIDIFVFINPLSGSQEGKKFLDLDLKKVEIELEQSVEVRMRMVDMTNGEKKKRSMKEIKHL